MDNLQGRGRLIINTERYEGIIQMVRSFIEEMRLPEESFNKIFNDIYLANCGYTRMRPEFLLFDVGSTEIILNKFQDKIKRIREKNCEISDEELLEKMDDLHI